MINIYVVLGILFIHWFADFVLQTDKQAKGKSKNLEDLLEHTFTYSVVWFIFCAIYTFPTFSWNIPIPADKYYFYCFKMCALFPSITFVLHTFTDYFTSRLNSKLWAAGKVHIFFVSVGFDQLLHFTQLLLTYYFLNL